jgi:hypothetical protein
MALLRLQTTFWALQIADPRKAFALDAIDAEICDVVPSDSDAPTGLAVASSALVVNVTVPVPA